MDKDVKYLVKRKVTQRCVNKKCVRYDTVVGVDGEWAIPVVMMCVYCGGEMKMGLR